MLRIPPPLLALAGGALFALLGQVQAAEPAMVKDGMLVDARGMTLYTNDRDAMGKSSCNDACAENWPPLAASADDKGDMQWSTLKRDDGSWQWAYGGKPLYTFKQDQKPGDKLGDGKMDVWHVAKPAAKSKSGGGSGY